MSAFNLMKAKDRKKLKRACQSELQAIKDKQWPRDTNDAMRWRTQDPARVASILESEIDYIRKVPGRIISGELKGWEL